MTTETMPVTGGPVDVEALQRDADQALRKRMPFVKWLRELSWRHLIALVVMVYAAFPILFLVSASLQPRGTLTGSNQLFSEVSWRNFALLNNHVNPLTGNVQFGNMYWTWFSNSLIIAAVTCIGTVLMGAAASYAFSRFRFTGRRFGLTALLIIQMFPQMLAFVAVFLLVLSLGQVFPILGFNSVLTLICIYWGGAL